MKVSREESLGQLLMVRVDEPRWNAARERWLRAFLPGGILLAPHLPRAPESTSEFLFKTARGLPGLPFLAIEEEVGTADPLRAFFPPLPSPRATAAKGLAAVACLAELTGEGLSLLGFNTNLAPVLNLSTRISETTLGAHTFGSDPQHVARCGRVYLHGLARHKILACGRHFPGLGSVPAQKSGDLPVSGKPMADLWREDLVPFRELLPDLPLIQVSHAAYKAYDFDLPHAAGLSSQVIEGLLRVKLGYRGVALSCQLEPEAVRGTLDLGAAAVQAINAGCDVLLAGSEKSAEVIRHAIERGAESGKIPPQRLERAMQRVRMTKKGLKPPTGKMNSRGLERLQKRFEDFSKEFRPQEITIAS